MAIHTRSTRTRLIASLALAGGLALAGCAQAAENESPGARATLAGVDGAHIGTVDFFEQEGTVRVAAEVNGVSPGFHGFHIHAVGACEPPFASAEGHFDPDGAAHGDHAGDMPPLLVNSDGSARATFTTDRFTIADVLARAVILHAEPDNLANIPERYNGADEDTRDTGDAGDRLACGVIEEAD